MLNDEVKIIPVYESVQSLNSALNRPLNLLNVESMWKRNFKGDGVNIAVLDTGCDVQNEEFQNRILGGANFSTDDNGEFYNFSDYNGHGTHVAGIISTNNLNEETSIAPEAKMLIIKVLDQYGNGSISQLINGIYYSINWRGKKGERIRILCLSLGTKEDRKDLQEAIKVANEKGITVIAASGNDRRGDLEEINLRYPGYYNEVVQVGSVSSSLNISTFSNINNQLDLLAPGEHINSVHLNNQYKKMSGTSMAAPFVAGGMALILEELESNLDRELSESEMYAQLVKRTKVLSSVFKQEGNGLLYF